MFVTIELKGMQFFAYHGFYEEERLQGTDFLVDVQLEAPAQKAIKEDALEGTVNYEKVYEIVKEEMMITSKLLEHVAGRILGRLENTFLEIRNIHVCIYKLKAPIGGELKHLSVTLSSRR